MKTCTLCRHSLSSTKMFKITPYHTIPSPPVSSFPPRTSLPWSHQQMWHKGLASLLADAHRIGLLPLSLEKISAHQSQCLKLYHQWHTLSSSLNIQRLSRVTIYVPISFPEALPSLFQCSSLTCCQVTWCLWPPQVPILNPISLLRQSHLEIFF